MRRKIKNPSENNLQRRIVYALYALYEHYGLDSMYRVIKHVVAFLPAAPEAPRAPDELAATLAAAWQAEFSKCKAFRLDGGMCCQCVGYLRSLIFPQDVT